MTTTLATRALDHIIERPRLIAQLAEGDAHVSLLVAPAGYGKTTLARQWSARQTGPVAWYRTTRASGDVAALAVGLDDLLNKTVPQPSRDPRRIAAIASVNARPLPLARALVSTHRSLTRDLLLVLDEWEAAGTEEADELMAHVVDELDIRVLVTSRSHPPWFTSRLTVYGEGLEIGMDALAMTDEEALSVLSTDRVPENPEPLLTTARGWPAVLGLAAMRGNDVPSRGLVSEMLYDFLATELLQLAPPPIQDGLSLLAAASVGEMTVARLLLGDEIDSVLTAAARLGLASSDADSVVLHPLLRELLIARLRNRDSETRQSTLEKLGVLVTNERWDEALATAEALPNGAFVSEALRAALDQLLRAGRLETLRRWVEIGVSSGADAGVVNYVDGEIAARRGDYDRAQLVVERATRQLEGELAARAHLVAARCAHLAERAEQSRAHAEAARNLSESTSLRAAAIWAAFTEAVDNERPEADVILAAFEATGLDTVEQTVRAAQGSLLLAQLNGDLDSRLDDSGAVCSLLGTNVEPLVQTSFLNAYAHALTTGAHYQAGLDAANQEDRLAKDHELEFVHRYALLNRARALVGLRQFSVAGRCIANLRRELARAPDIYVGFQAALQTAALYLSMGDVVRAEAALLLDVPHRLSKSITAERLAMRALTSAAAGNLADARTDAELARGTSRLLEIQALAAVAEAIVSLEEELVEEATLAVDEVLATACLNAIVLGIRSYPGLAPVVAEVAGKDRLAAIFLRSNDTGLAHRVGIAIPRSRLRSATLSPRELEIHGLIAQGMTNREISSLLFISQSTTKVHVQHILEKLGVRSRVEAARVWQETEKPDPD